MQMNTSLYEIGTAALLGLATTSSSIVGAILGLYAGLSKRILGCILAFAAGALISALAIELGYQGAEMLRGFGLTTTHAWWFVSVGFGIGAIVYYGTSLFLEGKGAAVRYATRFREYALARSTRPRSALNCSPNAVSCAIYRPRRSRKSCPAFAAGMFMPAKLCFAPGIHPTHFTSSPPAR